MTTGDIPSTPIPSRLESEPVATSELYSVAKEGHAVIEAWSGRMTEAAVSGRSATIVARMATARAASDLRKLRIAPGGTDDPVLEELHGAVAAYFKRLNAIVSRAGHEVERNRYSLEVMHAELERLGRLFAVIFPSEEGATESESASRVTARSVDGSSGADEGSADGEIGSG